MKHLISLFILVLIIVTVVQAEESKDGTESCNLYCTNWFYICNKQHECEFDIFGPIWRIISS
ncbi:unnamed protein product [Callosobruchus maculatus]|uniref:Uncharacterized protein n=1 Tax=Callosobruchus maculatus TaxID=64391 RepID=A0A653C9B7_CALMS|nr:unnamed protein product [Callosobruchus maculatus]